MLGLVIGTGCLYPGIAATCCDTDTDAHADSHTDTAVTHADSHTHAAIGYDASRRCAVWCLASISEDATLAVARRVDVLMARLWICLHCNGDCSTSAVNCGVERLGWRCVRLLVGQKWQACRKVKLGDLVRQADKAAMSGQYYQKPEE